jgi:hypothetical protein
VIEDSVTVVYYPFDVDVNTVTFLTEQRTVVFIVNEVPPRKSLLTLSCLVPYNTKNKKHGSNNA